MRLLVFSIPACIPTAQSVGGIALAMGLACGNLVLTVAVLSILITAPLGAIAIDVLTPRLLTHER